MIRTIVKWGVAALAGLLSACVIMTVNVYFPEKAVKDAYKSLDEMLLKQGQHQPADQPAVEPKPGGEQPAVDKPQSRLFERFPSFSLVPEARADNYADDLAIEMSDMPDVLKAYDEMRGRLPRIQALLAAGNVGISNQGLVEIRMKGKVSPEDEALLKAENASRKVVVTGMARAILKLNRQPETSSAMGQVLPKAAATYADIKREEAKPGMWYQLQNGRWIQK